MADGIQAVILSSVKKHPIMIYSFGGFCLLLVMPPIYKILLFFSPLLLSTAVCMVTLMFLGPSTSLNGSAADNHTDGEQQQSLAVREEDDGLASLVNQFRTCIEPRVNMGSRHEAPLNIMAAAARSDVGHAGVDHKIELQSARKYIGPVPQLKGDINSGSSTWIESDKGAPWDDSRPDRAAEADHHEGAARPAECDGQSAGPVDPDLAMEESRPTAAHAMENKGAVRALRTGQDRRERTVLQASLSSSNPISRVLQAVA